MRERIEPALLAKQRLSEAQIGQLQLSGLGGCLDDQKLARSLLRSWLLQE